MDGGALRPEVRHEWEPLVGPGDGGDQGEGLSKGPLHGPLGRGREQEETVSGRVQRALHVEVLRQVLLTSRDREDSHAPR